MNQQATGKGDTTYVDQAVFVKGLTEGLLKTNTLSADLPPRLEQQQYDTTRNNSKMRNADFLAQYLSKGCEVYSLWLALQGVATR